jgi:hypothetical protein
VALGSFKGNFMANGGSINLNQFRNNNNSEMMVEVIAKSVYEASLRGTSMGTSNGISGYNDNLQNRNQSNL